MNPSICQRKDSLNAVKTVSTSMLIYKFIYNENVESLFCVMNDHVEIQRHYIQDVAREASNISILFGRVSYTTFLGKCCGSQILFQAPSPTQQAIICLLHRVVSARVST